MRSYVQPGRTIRIRFDMVKGTGGDEVEDLLGPVGDYEDSSHPSDASGSRDDSARALHGHRRGDAVKPLRRARGELRLSVRPSDASIYIDGEFEGTADQVTSLRLTSGRHRIDVVHPGFRAAERDVEVGGDQPVDLELDLERP